MEFIYHHRTMGRGSQAMHIRSLVEALESAGHDVTVVSPPGVDPLATAGVMPFLRKEDRARGVQRIWKYISRECSQLLFETCELLYNFLIPIRLLPILWKKPNAVVYERHAYFMFMGVLLGKLLKRTVILEVNELAGFKRARGLIMEPCARRIDAWVFSKVDYVLCVSSVLANVARQRSAKPERVHVVPNAIDTNRFVGSEDSLALRARLGLEDSIVIGHVGLFYPWDRLDVLIELVHRIRVRHPEVKVLLVGDGPEMDKLRQTARQSGLESAVVFSGPVDRDDVSAYIDAMDICVLPDSNAFGSPIALFEFMAMAKPSVVPDLGPMLDVIDDNVTGLIFPHGDYAALERTLVRLVEDPALRTELGNRAKDTVFERHTWASNAEVVVDFATGGKLAGSRTRRGEIQCEVGQVTKRELNVLR